jgi:class 3 adenylate cyclase
MSAPSVEFASRPASSSRLRCADRGFEPHGGVVQRGHMPAPQTRGFLFADLRGYTRYTEQYGDAAAGELIGRYRALVRREIAAFHGAEIRTEGDSFYVVFDSVSEAVQAGLAIRDAAADASAAADTPPIRVGIGIHAGESTDGEHGIVSSARGRLHDAAPRAPDVGRRTVLWPAPVLGICRHARALVDVRGRSRPRHRDAPRRRPRRAPDVVARSRPVPPRMTSARRAVHRSIAQVGR